MDKKDLYAYFHELRIKNGSNYYENIDTFNKLFSNTSLTNLDIKRIYRLLDKNIKKDDIVIDE